MYQSQSFYYFHYNGWRRVIELVIISMANHYNIVEHHDITFIKLKFYSPSVCWHISQHPIKVFLSSIHNDHCDNYNENTLPINTAS